MMLEERVRRIFGKSTHLKLLLLFYNNPTYFDNIEGLAKQLGKSHVTTRKVVNDLCKVGILKDFYKVRKGGVKDRIVMLNKSNPKAVFNLLERVEEVCAMEMERRSEEETAEEMIEKGKERRSRIVQELFKLYDRVRELEGELEEEITEILKRLDEDDFIVEFYGTTLENDGLEYWTQRGKEIYVRVDGSIVVRGRNGTYIIGSKTKLL